MTARTKQEVEPAQLGSCCSNCKRQLRGLLGCSRCARIVVAACTYSNFSHKYSELVKLRPLWSIRVPFIYFILSGGSS